MTQPATKLTINNLHIKPYSKKPDELFELLQAQKAGLDSAQAQSRLAQFGPNQIEQKEGHTIWEIIGDQFRDLLIWILFFASIFSFFLGEEIDAVAILSIIIINTILGFAQEYKAEKSLEALRKMETLRAEVIRNGEEALIEANQIVPGDIILLGEGDKVPADARLLKCNSLQVDESMLTGESVSATKKMGRLEVNTSLADRENMVYSGTMVTRGKAKALVIRTGMKTQIGQIAQEIRQAPQEATPLQKALDKLGKTLAIISLSIAIPGLIIGLFLGREPVEMIMMAISLAVSTIPEGLPIVVTLGLAMGIKRMTKVNVLVRKLSTAESLGGTGVICTDKTGTITKNKMTVSQVYLPNVGTVKISNDQNEHSTKLKDIGQAATLCSDATLEVGDPTEQALLIFAQDYELDPKRLKDTFSRVDEAPFNSDDKFMIVQVRGNDLNQVIIKGAPEVIWSKINSDQAGIEKLSAVNEELSAQGLRVLALARKKLDSKVKNLKLSQIDDFEFLGLIGMYDPPREEVKSALNLCHQAGIRVIMITGDHKQTALAIAQEVGLDTIGAYTGSQLDQMDDAYLTKVVKEANVFARVSPRHKVQILKKLQELGHQVAMTGDGVNDAPAIKRADVGIAVGAGTDLTKSVSDMILLDNDFSTIAKAIEEGRRIFFNIKKFVRYLLSANFDEVARVLTSIVFSLPLSLLPIHILWLNLVTDSFPALALTVDEAEPGIMSKKPYHPQKEILKGVLSFSLAAAAIGYFVIFGVFLYCLNFCDQSLIYTRTISFTSTVLFELVLVFSMRSERPTKLKDVFTNKWLWLSLIVSLLAQLWVVYHPWGQAIFKTTAIKLEDWGLILGVSSSGFIGIEIIKRLRSLKNE